MKKLSYIGKAHQAPWRLSISMVLNEDSFQSFNRIQQVRRKQTAHGVKT